MWGYRWKYWTPPVNPTARRSSNTRLDALVGIVEEDASKFRNVIPDAVIPFIQAMEAKAWEVGKGDALWGGFPE